MNRPDRSVTSAESPGRGHWPRAASEAGRRRPSSAGRRRRCGAGARRVVPERDRAAAGVLAIGSGGKVVEVARDARGRRLSRLPARSPGGQRPGLGSLLVRVSARVPRDRAPTRVSPSSPRSRKRLRIVQASRQVSVVHLLLDQPIIHRPVLFLELGDLGLQLLVLELKMAQRGFHLPGRRAAAEQVLTSRAARDQAQRASREPAGRCSARCACCCRACPGRSPRSRPAFRQEAVM